MEFEELIKERRAVRTYEEGKTVSQETIKEIIAEAQLAPSWKNSQTARYYVANTPEAIEKVKAALPEVNQTRVAGVSALIVTSFVKDVSGFTAGQADNELSNKWGAYDLGLNNAYFILAAKNSGLDTLIMGLRDADALRKVFGIPKQEQITSVIALGYGAGEPVFRPRKETDEICSFM